MIEANKFNAYRGRKVLVTGHTGFKGSWLCQWLLNMEAKVYGYALEPSTSPSLHDQLGHREKFENKIADIRDLKILMEFVDKVKPDVIFHLAAQPLVRESYLNPLETLETNVTGTANLLEAVRLLGLKTSIVVITSDKCYDNKEWIHGYRENDAFGGYDPYSASKGAAEIVVASWRNSFFKVNEFKDQKVNLASARAGNVIGGGDWSKDRIVPDCIRELQSEKVINVRNPLATRPWQHVLESLGGYLLLGTKLLDVSSTGDAEMYCSGFNFGPFSTSNKTVQKLVEQILKNWMGTWEFKKEDAMHEAFLLNLNIDKAIQLLGWSPVWQFEKTIEKTTEWYKIAFDDSARIEEITNSQINEYSNSFWQLNKSNV